MPNLADPIVRNARRIFPRVIYELLLVSLLLLLVCLMLCVNMNNFGSRLSIFCAHWIDIILIVLIAAGCMLSYLMLGAYSETRDMDFIS